jgi:hypothetical protein
MKQWRVRALLVGCAAFLVASPAWAPPLPAGGWGPGWSWLKADPQRALALLAGAAGWLLAAWLFLVTALRLIAASAHAASSVAERAAVFLTPRFARGALEFMLGAALAVGGGAPALAAGIPAGVSASTQPSLAPVPAPVVAPPELPPLLDLDRPDVKPAVSTPSAPAPAAPAVHPALTHRVRPGDTLWGLAAARLPVGSSAQQITRGWQEWYLANRQQIGPDPSLLLLGESLRVPGVAS